MTEQSERIIADLIERNIVITKLLEKIVKHEQRQDERLAALEGAAMGRTVAAKGGD